jgi:SAM-dependent methyltransferase
MSGSIKPAVSADRVREHCGLRGDDLPMEHSQPPEVSTPCAPRGPAYGYLCVEGFLKSVVAARALASALELGLIDYLAARPDAEREALCADLRIDGRGLGLLCDLLFANGVCEEERGRLRLSEGFRRALQYRDLLEAKLDFAQLAFSDFLGGLTALIAAPDEFRRRSGIFRLFDYGRCYDSSPESEALTRRWVRITTALTRYEAAACLAHYDFARHRRLLDIGGNSGEFALQICRRVPALQATVFDLPLVCQIGQAHVGRAPEAARIAFASGNALADALPGGFDLVTFKSVLHDWPEKEACHLIQQASRSLEAGGTLLIFERGPFEASGAGVPYSVIPFLLFFRSFRAPTLYRTQLESLGFREVTIRPIVLEMPFFLVTGVKGS